MDRVEQQSQTTEFKITWKDATTYASLDGGTDTLKMCTRKGKKKNHRLEEAQDIPTTQLCKGCLQSFRVYFGEISSLLKPGI